MMLIVSSFIPDSRFCMEVRMECQQGSLQKNNFRASKIPNLGKTRKWPCLDHFLSYRLQILHGSRSRLPAEILAKNHFRDSLKKPNSREKQGNGHNSANF